MDPFTGMAASAPLLANSLEVAMVGSVNAMVVHRGCDEEARDHNHHHNHHHHGHEDEEADGPGQEVLYEEEEEEEEEEEAGRGANDLVVAASDGVGGRRAKRRKKYRGPRSWKEKWQELHPWAFVRSVNGEERMFCTVCEAHGNTSTRNAFRKEGSSNFQPSALSTHANSSAHKNALLMQRAWSDTGKIGLTSKTRGKIPAATEYSVIANHLATMASKLSSVVTRDEFNALRSEWRIMQKRKDARRINCCCALTDPLMPVPTLDGIIPENLPNSLAELVALPTEHVETLLMAYDLPVHGTADAKLRRLKAYLGFRSF